MTAETYMVRIPWSARDAYHVVGEVGESDPNSEPSRAFWTNASVKALMASAGPQPEYISRCGRVRGDWRSIQISTVPPSDRACQQCTRSAA